MQYSATLVEERHKDSFSAGSGKVQLLFRDTWIT